MKLIKHIELKKDIISKLLSFFPIKTFKSQSHLFYEGQIPIVGYLVIDGAIKITKNNKQQKILKPGSLFGLSELIHKKPSKISAEVLPETSLCFLDKSTILEIAGQADNDITSLLKQIFDGDK